MKIIYRISDTGYNKIKPLNINNNNCLKNAIDTFENSEFLIIADNVSDDTKIMIENMIGNHNIEYVSVGHGAGTFNLALDCALKQDENLLVYFMENDYLHKSNSIDIINNTIISNTAEGLKFDGGSGKVNIANNIIQNNDVK